MSLSFPLPNWLPDDIRQMIKLYELPDGERKQLQVMLEKTEQSLPATTGAVR